MKLRFLALFSVLMAHAFGAVTGNFNNRTGTTAIPTGMFVTGITSLTGSTPLAYLPAAGLNVVRLSVDISAQCPAGTCGWSIPNAQLTLLSAQGLKVLVILQLTPSNLGVSTCTPPSNNATWAGYANAFLSQAATNFPGTVVAAEIWNEPDLSPNWCNTSGTALSTFESFIGSVGPTIASANPGVLIGGPALASPTSNGATWVPGVIAAWSGIQFISYHYYNSAQTTWANYLAAMQSVTNGIGATYANIQGFVTTAGSSAKILITETNNNPSFSGGDCCRNDGTFGPLWNVLMAIDYLNAIGTYGASTIPANVFYFTSQTSTANFCLVGQVDSAMDCNNTGTVVAYPQYYAYMLLNTYLGLSGGGNLAASISPGSTTAGLSAAAFYTSGADSIVMVNPTASPVSTGTITFNNAGLSNSTRATTYLLNANNASGTVSTVPLTTISGGYTAAAITIPANSTLAISISATPAAPTSVVVR
jgi:hypothetical protein